MKGIKPGLHFGPKKNSTSAAGEHHNGVYTNSKSDLEKNGHTASICVGALVGLAVLALCGLLYYRHTRRRRRRSGIDQEKARRESIRQAVRARLQELEDEHDYTPWLEQTKIRTSLVTFGDVVLLDPSQSPDDSPVPGHHSYYSNDIQHRVSREPHHHHIYSSSKRRVHHIPSGRDYSQISYHQQNQAQILQRQLSINGDHPKDTKMRKYPNSDHPRFSVHAMIQPTTQRGTEIPANSTNIQMSNSDHHKLSLHRKIQPTTEHAREVLVNSTPVPMPNNEHQRLSLHRRLEPATEHERPAMVSSASLIHMKNNDHHKMSLHRKMQSTTEHARETSVNSTHVPMPNNDHQRLSLHRRLEPATEHAREAMVSSTSLIHMKNNDHHKLSLHKKIQPTAEHAREISVNSTNRPQMYTAHNSNGSSTSKTNVSQNSSATFNRKVVLHNGDSRRID